MNKFTIIMIALLSILIQGCQNQSFAPINVPQNMAFVVEEHVAMDNKINDELRKLHIIEYNDVERINVGDTFNLYVANHPELTRYNVLIMRNGTISVAPIGVVNIAGRTISEISIILSNEYNKFVSNSQVIIEPVNFEDNSFTILGAVSSPGVFTLPLKTTRITDAIAIANGLARIDNNGGSSAFEIADLTKAYILRDGKKLPANFDEAVTKGNSLHNIPIKNNDYIYIPTIEGSRITILGEVENPTCISFQSEMTLLQTIGYANGLKDSYSKNIKIIRGGLENPVVLNVDIEALRSGKFRDLALKPHDIIYVPKYGLSDYNVYINDIIPTFHLLNSAAGPFGNPASLIYD